MKAWPHSKLAQTLRLYLVTDQHIAQSSAGPRSLLDVVAQAVQGGVTCVQLREKSLSTRDFLAQAITLKALLRPLGIALVINDRIDIALACAADGVHLGQSDMPPEDARRLLPPEIFIGWSVETLADVRQSERLPVDYLAASPVFATPSKTDTAPAWGLDGLRTVRAASTLPLVAIGGIDATNAREVFAAGADGIAVISALCAAADPRRAAQTLRDLCKPN